MQPRAVLFRAELGHDHLDDWSERSNSNVEESLLTADLERRGYSAAGIDRISEKTG